MQKRIVALGFAICSVFVLVLLIVSPERISLKSVAPKSTSDFQQVWGDWVGRVTREVKAAVDVSSGLSPEKKKSLNGLLMEDLARDFGTAQVIVKTLDAKYQDEMPKSHKLIKKGRSEHTDSPATASKNSARKHAAQKSAAKVAAALKAKAKIAEPEKNAGKPVQLPFNKRFAAKVAVDDQRVANAEKQATKAASKLLKIAAGEAPLRAAKSVAHSPGAPAVSAAASAAPEASTAWRAAANAALVATSRAAAPLSRHHAAAHPRRARPSLAVDIQQALQAEMRRNRGNADLARRMTREEEQSWNSELRKWGLAA